MIVGIHSRDNDLVVNATRTKQLTNFRVSGKEDAIKITPPIELHAGVRRRVHRGRRAGRNHAQVDPSAQAPPERERAQARLAFAGLSMKATHAHEAAATARLWLLDGAWWPLCGPSRVWSRAIWMAPEALK